MHEYINIQLWKLSLESLLTHSNDAGTQSTGNYIGKLILYQRSVNSTSIKTICGLCLPN